MSKIYTKKGDSGETTLIGSTRIPKFDPVLEVIGHLDELNCQIGFILSQVQSDHVAEKLLSLQKLQHQLFDIGASIAGYPDPPIADSDITFLEEEIDRLTQTLPELKNFILPGGSSLSALLHQARAIARRVERCFWYHVEISSPSNKEDDLLLVGKFLNRLSDYLFTLARSCNTTEILYRKRKDRR